METIETKTQVLVFKTNLKYKRDLDRIKPILDGIEYIVGWNIDREDADKILRIESAISAAGEIIKLVNDAGYRCEELND